MKKKIGTIKKPEKWLILIILFALFLRLNFFVGFDLNDDLAYLNNAHHILTGKFHPNIWIFSLRPMMNFPIAVSYILFGVNDFSAGFWPLVTSIGGIVVTFYLGKTIINERVGLLAAFLMSFFPIDVFYSTTVTPDVPISFFMALSVLLFLKGKKTKKRSYVFYLLSGISIALGYMAKSLAIIIFLFFIFYVLLKRKIKMKYGFIVLGFLIIYSLFGLYYFLETKDFLLDYHGNSEHYTTLVLGTISDLMFYPRILFPNINPEKVNPYFNYFGYFFYFLVISTVYLLIKGVKKLYVFILWLVVILFYLEFGSMSLYFYKPIHRLWRFLCIITIPSSLIISSFLVENKLPFKKIILLISVLFLLISSLYYIDKTTEYEAVAMSDFKLSYQFLKNQPKKNIYADPDCIGKLNFYFEYKRDDLRDITRVKDVNEIKDSYVIVDCSRGYVEAKNLRKEMPEFVWNPPEDWKILKVINESNLEYYSHFDTTIYYAP